MFLNRFAHPIVEGTKRQTIRPPRKRPVKVGQALSLRVWTDKAYRSPQRKLIDTTCIAVFDILITRYGYRLNAGRMQTDLDDFARADGFQDWQEFIGHFEGFYGLPFHGVLIQWEVAHG
jgi:hypothetical protein